MSSRLFVLKSYLTVLRAALRHQRIAVPKDDIIFERSFIFEPEMKKSWSDFYEADGERANVPFMYHCRHTSVGVYFFIKKIG